MYHSLLFEFTVRLFRDDSAREEGIIPPIDVLEKKNISINQLSSVVEKQKNAYSVVFLGDSYGDFFFAWAWGDGKTDVTKDRVAEHLYARAGFYNATVNVKSTTFLSESQTIGFYVTVNSSATVVGE